MASIHVPFRFASTRRILLFSFLVVSTLAAACASTEDASTDGSDSGTYERPPSEGFYLAPADPQVRTVQVYRTGDETALPVIQMRSRETITVAFDVMSNDSRPITAYFYHADRNWRRDLSPAEYLTSFHKEDVFEYSISRSSEVPYTHYTYSFPSRSIDFQVSGNYVLRIARQGMEDDVLFERPFFVTEQAMALDIRLDNVLVPGRGYSSVQPFVRFRPPGLNANAFDISVCFVRNDVLEAARCTERPGLAAQPDLAYYLEPDDAFELTPANYFLDMSEIRIGGKIEYTDLSVQPPLVGLSPDYARFPGSIQAPFLNGQTVVENAVRNVLDPGVSAEYARVYFRFVPIDEVRASGRVVVTGSFNNWTYDPAYALSWVEERKWYEGSVLLKQGHYEYRYAVDDPRLVRAMQGAPPQARNLYTTFVYLDDVRVSTDRLLAATGILTY